MPARLSTVAAKSTKPSETAALPAGGVLRRPQVPELLRDVQDQRHAQAGVVGPALAAGQPTPWSAQ